MRKLFGTRPVGMLFSSLGLVANDPFTVLAGTTVVMDINTPSLGYTTIAGTVRFMDTGLTLTTTGINVQNGGLLELGTESVPLTSNTTISLTGAYVPLTNTTINSFTTPTNSGTSRGIMVDAGGTLDMHGTPPTTLWTTLGAAYNGTLGAPNTSVTLASSPVWTAQDVAIAITEFPSTYPSLLGDVTEQRTITTAGTSGVLSSTLSNTRYGDLQYPVDVLVGGSGMSLTQNTFSAKKAHFNVPIVLDQRARLANLTRNIVVSCPADTDWSVKGHGVHIMWMASGATLSLVRLAGVQVRRGGQRGALGRYPFHAHMNSYTAGTGAFTADTPLNYVKKCVVWQSENRAYTIHGTCGMDVTDNIAYDIKGHALFLEDGSERRNNIRRNMMMKVRAPNTGSNNDLSANTRGDPINSGTGFVSISGNGTTTTVNWTAHGLYSGETITVSSASISGFNVYRTPCTRVDADHFTYLSSGSGSPTGAVFRHNNDTIKLHDYQSSGYWITNLDNYFEDNYASDCFSGDKNQTFIAGNGAWVSTAQQCFGLSSLVAINPNNIDMLLFKGFVCHSNYGQGLLFGGPVTDELGTALDPQLTKYSPASGNFSSTDHIFWKNETGAYFNNIQVGTYLRWTLADNGQVDFRGSTNIGVTSSQHLFIGNSLNSAILASLPAGHPSSPSPQDIYPRGAFFPYHGTVRFFDSTAVNYPYAKFVYLDAKDKGSAGGVSDGAPDNYDVPGVEYFQGTYNTNIQLINSHYGEMCPPIHLDGRSVDVPGLERHYAVAPVWCDVDGKYGTAGRFMIPYSRDASGNLTAVDDFFLSGAAAPVDGPLTGTVVCKTTATRYFGAGFSDASCIDSDTLTAWNSFFGEAPFTVTRQNVATGATIGTPYLRKSNNIVNPAFATYASWAMQSGGRYSIDFTDGSTTISPPASYLYFQLCNANTTGDFVILGLPWANASVPRICFGNTFSNENATTQRGVGQAAFFMNTFASAGDVAANRATLVTTPGTLAQVVADTSGQTYFRDTTNNRVWVRYTAKPFTAHPSDFGGLGAIYDIQFVIIKV